MAFRQVLPDQFQADRHLYRAQHVECLVVRVVLFGGLSLLLQLELVVLLDEDGHVENLLGGRPLLWVDLEERAQDRGKIRRVVRWDLRVNSFHDSLIETFHVLGREGRVEGHQLVEDAAERPDIRLVVVGFVLPDLGTRIVRRASLRLQNARLGNLRNIEISQLDHALFRQKHVCALYISMDDLFVVKGLQAQYHLVENGPDVVFLRKLRSLFGIINLGLQVAVIAILHNDAETGGAFLKECLFVTGNIRMVHRCQDAHLVQCVLLFLRGQFLHFYL